METIADLLQRGADDAAAIGAPEGLAPLRYRDLRALVRRTVADLNSFGIGRGDRVVLVLPNGPEAAAAFVSVGAGATTAPLSRGLTADEFEFNLTDLRAKALLVEAGLDSPARAVASRLRIPTIELVPHRDQGAGAFSLRLLLKNGAGPFEGGLAQPDDEALVLHTSGSTSRPKIVPLLQRNVTASARNIMTALQLTPDDVCLNIMPLFHIHGLMAAVLSSLAAGAQVHCSPGFNALRFFHWLDEVRPTWYTGVPAGPEVAIMDEEGKILPRGQTGEVVIRGANVTPGYEANPEANESAFLDDWFRTGDQGFIDRDGYLRLTGRLKELINRGGEKIAPIEIDVVLMDHPAVQQCVAFAIPHHKLGEDIAAAVVLREGHTCTDRELREFAARRLEHWKVPRKFVFVHEIPKGRTGKLQRIGL